MQIILCRTDFILFCVHIYLVTYLCMYVCMYIYIYIYIYVYIYIYIYIYIYTHTVLIVNEYTPFKKYNFKQYLNEHKNYFQNVDKTKFNITYV